VSGHIRVRQWMVVATGAVTLLLAGCTLPDGVDGELTDGWSAMGEPVGFVPVAGTCHAEEYQDESTLEGYNPIGCAEEHVTEIVHVGEFGEAASGRTTPPEPGSDEWKDAFNGCQDAAADYLGADYRFARLWLGVVVPSSSAWEGGARWFRCDVLQYEGQILFDATRTGSLAGALADESSELRLTCFEVDAVENDIERMEPAGCDDAHQAEFVGVWQAPDGEYLSGEDTETFEQVHTGCRETVAEYVDLPVDGDLEFRTGTIADWMDETDWNNGDRGFRCYLWLNGEELTESLRGAGPDAMPILEG
jgi:Septum formation